MKTTLKSHLSHWQKLKSPIHTLLKNLWKNEQFHRLSKGEQNGITSTESNIYQTTDTFIIYSAISLLAIYPTDTV